MGIIKEFHEVTCRRQRLRQQIVFHHILTSGLPVAERTRRLASNKLKAPKAEIKTFADAGICRPSSSPWASPMQVVLKRIVRRVCAVIIAG